MHRFETAQRECTSRGPPDPQGRQNLGTTGRSNLVQQAGRKQRLLADPPSGGIPPTHHLHHAGGAILLQQTPLLHLQRVRALPETDEKILSGLEGLVCQMDDVLVFGATQDEHDKRLIAALKRIETAGVTLNPNKCEFNKRAVKFLGHLVDENGIRADPEKSSAISKMEPPRNISELRRFMGMANQLGKFSHRLAELSQPLRELLSTKRA